MPVPRPTLPAVVTLAASLSLLLSGCSDKSTPPPLDPVATGSAAPSASDAAADPQGLAVPGVPDPCALLSASQVIEIAHLPANSRSGPIVSNSGGRSCVYNSGHPSMATISLTAVTKAGFDAFRATIPANTVSDLPGLGQEAYRSSQTPGVVDVFKNGFDLNISVVHADRKPSAAVRWEEL